MKRGSFRLRKINRIHRSKSLFMAPKRRDLDECGCVRYSVFAFVIDVVLAQILCVCLVLCVFRQRLQTLFDF